MTIASTGSPAVRPCGAGARGEPAAQGSARTASSFSPRRWPPCAWRCTTPTAAAGDVRQRHPLRRQVPGAWARAKTPCASRRMQRSRRSTRDLERRCEASTWTWERPILDLHPVRFDATTVIDAFEVGGEIHRVTASPWESTLSVVSDRRARPRGRRSPLRAPPAISQAHQHGFVQVLSPSEVKVRVWGRGSGETAACGTGARQPSPPRSPGGPGGAYASISSAGISTSTGEATATSRCAARPWKCSPGSWSSPPESRLRLRRTGSGSGRDRDGAEASAP